MSQLPARETKTFHCNIVILSVRACFVVMCKVFVDIIYYSVFSHVFASETFFKEIKQSLNLLGPRFSSFIY